MAGDWIKMRCALQDDPAVLAIAAACELDSFAVVGRLHRFWTWADTHTTDGNAESVTPAFIDAHCCAPGFGAALIKVGWLAPLGKGFRIPKFDRHNGKTAKKRALGARRAAAHRRNAGSVTKGAAREEKRRDGSSEGEKEGRAQKKKKSPDQQILESLTIPPSLNTPEVRSAIRDWLSYKRSRGERYKSADHFSRKLKAFADLPPAFFVDAVESSMGNNYSGLFANSAKCNGKPAGARTIKPLTPEAMRR